MYATNALAACALLGLLCQPLAAQAQAAAADWRAANEAVAQFPRGHADLLKWEQANPQPAPANPVRGAMLTLASLEEGVRQAWSLHAELRPTLAQLDPATRAALASGRWHTLAPQPLRRVEGLHELLATTARFHKDWAGAVAAEQALQQAAAVLRAAGTARELGERMVAVGNWSRLQQAPWQLAEASARMGYQRALASRTQAQSRLIQQLGVTGQYQTLSLSLPAPELPPQDVDDAQVQARAEALRAQLPAAERLRHQDSVFQAYAAYLGAYAVAAAAQDSLQVRSFMAEETVLHYNGMLKSTWDVLGETQNHMLAISAAANARRDLAVARMDLEWVLLGGEPAGLVNLGGGDAAPAAAGH